MTIGSASHSIQSMHLDEWMFMTKKKSLKLSNIFSLLIRGKNNLIEITINQITTPWCVSLMSPKRLKFLITEIKHDICTLIVYSICIALLQISTIWGPWPFIWMMFLKKSSPYLRNTNYITHYKWNLVRNIVLLS